MTATKPPTKASLRARAKLERQITKGLNRAFLEIARQQAKAISKTPPPEFQQWGVFKSRAWLKAASLCQRLARRERPKTEALLAAASALHSMKGWTPEQSMEFLQPPKKDKATKA